MVLSNAGKKAILTDTLLFDKGKYFTERPSCSDVSASGGWLSHFKCRYWISLKTLHGEANSVDVSIVSAARIQRVSHVMFTILINWIVLISTSSM